MEHVEEMIANGVPAPVTVFDNSAQANDCTSPGSVGNGGGGGCAIADTPYGGAGGSGGNGASGIALIYYRGGFYGTR